MNRLTFAIEARDPSEARVLQDPREYNVRLKVDGHELAPSPDVHIGTWPLAYSRHYSGELYIFTCACGEPLCAGVERGVRVRHAGDYVLWRVPDPIAYPPDDTPLASRGYRFHWPQYRAAVTQCLNRLKRLGEPGIAGGPLSKMTLSRPLHASREA